MPDFLFFPLSLIFNCQIPTLVFLAAAYIIKRRFQTPLVKPWGGRAGLGLLPFSLCSHWLGFVSFHINYSYFCWSQLHGSAPLELPKTPGGVFIAQVGLHKEFSILFCRRGWNFPSNLTSLIQKQFLDLLLQRGVFQTGRVTQKISFFPLVFSMSQRSSLNNEVQCSPKCTQNPVKHQNASACSVPPQPAAASPIPTPREGESNINHSTKVDLTGSKRSRFEFSQ